MAFFYQKSRKIVKTNNATFHAKKRVQICLLYMTKYKLTFVMAYGII